MDDLGASIMLGNGSVLTWAVIAIALWPTDVASAAGHHATRVVGKTAANVQPVAADDSGYWSNLGKSQMEAEKYGDAVYSFTAAIVKGNDKAEVFANRGWANYQLGNYKIALMDFDKAIAREPANAAILNQRGIIRHTLGDYGAAITDYDRSLKMDRTDAAVWANRALSHFNRGNTDKALRDIDRAVALDPNSPALETRSRLRYDLGDWKASVADADKAIALKSQQDWPYYLRAWGKVWLGDYDGAIADASVLVVRDKNNRSARFVRAAALQFAGRTDAALAEAGQAIYFDPAYAYRTRAYLNITAGRVTQALADARQSVAFAPQSEGSASILGWALIENGDPSAAIAECTRSLEIKENSGAYSCRAAAQLALNKPEAARPDANQAHNMDESSGNIYYLLGRIDLAQGKTEAALQKFSQASKLEMYNKAGLFMYRGDAEKARGNIKRARSDYQTAMKFNFGRYTQALEERFAKLPAQ